MLPSEMKTLYDEIETATQYITKIKSDLDKANYELIKIKAKIMKYNIIELANQYHKNCKNLDEIINR